MALKKIALVTCLLTASITIAGCGSESRSRRGYESPPQHPAHVPEIPSTVAAPAPSVGDGDRDAAPEGGASRDASAG